MIRSRTLLLSAYPRRQQIAAFHRPETVRKEEAGPNDPRVILQEAGMIAYMLGHTTIVDRKQLLAHVCECYEVVKAEHERLLGFRSSADLLFYVCCRTDGEHISCYINSADL